jgi:hypothetical protein
MVLTDLHIGYVLTPPTAREDQCNIRCASFRRAIQNCNSARVRHSIAMSRELVRKSGAS